MDTLALDFECYWANDYSATTLGTEAYVRDPRYETVLVGLKVNDTPEFWVLPERFEQFITEEVNWDDTALITHHAHFDGSILSWHYGIKPAMHIDTLSMARVIDGPKAGNSLAQLGPRHGFGEKGHDTQWSKGKRLKDFTRDEIKAYGVYCCNDVRLTYLLAQKFMAALPGHELQLISQNVKMFTEPVFVGDVEKLRGAVTAERARKKELLTRLGYVCVACNGSGITPDLINGTVPCKKCAGLGIDKKPFSSKEKFAAILRGIGVEPETKPSPTAGLPPIYAFARTDPYMQALLADEDEVTRVLAEARVNVTSTIIETRAQRFLECAQRGPIPAYLSHAGAHTLRPSGGDGTNMLNMSKHIDGAKRPELAVLRQSIRAPEGQKIVSADSSQGEARILAWLARQQDLVEAFAQGRDVYSEHASLVYGRPVDRRKVKVDYIPGQVGKVCLGEGTLVVTNTGTKPIERVTMTDTLWDGIQWVKHQGLIFQGVKEVVEGASLRATTDHEILTGRGWREWNEVRKSPSLFQSALDLANSPFLGGGSVSLPAEGASIKRCVGAPADQKRTSLDTRLKVGALHDAMLAPRKHPQKKDGGAMRALCPMLSIARGFLAGFRRRLLGVTTPLTNILNTTGSEVFPYAMNGAQTALPSYDTFRLFQGGIPLHWKWTAKRWMGIMNRAIFGLSPVLLTCKTSGRSLLCSVVSKNLKLKMRTYDLACAGPRSRFVVMTDRGPIIVHNCILSYGFGSGWYKSATELLKGALGAPPIQFKMEDMQAMSVDPSAFLNNPNHVARVAAMPSRLELNDRLIHCAVTKALVDRYRAKMQMITGKETGFWTICEQVIGAMIEGREMVFGAHGIFRTAKERIYGPTGLWLDYRGLERTEDGQASYWDGRKRTKIYGSLLTENIVQHTHRLIVGGQLLEIADAGLKVALWPYDEVVCVVPEEVAELSLQFMVSVMKREPAWAPGLPLAAEGGFGQTYAEC